MYNCIIAVATARLLLFSEFWLPLLVPEPFIVKTTCPRSLHLKVFFLFRINLNFNVSYSEKDLLFYLIIGNFDTTIIIAASRLTFSVFAHQRFAWVAVGPPRVASYLYHILTSPTIPS